ncbi:MAG: hypothetical protein JO256_09125 [Alphaproteobacteria bacterium]|nr:hypothetical protein [Alphaproteobacteria bacterium]
MTAASDFIAVAGRVITRTATAVLFAAGNHASFGTWLPRAFLHPEDDRGLDAMILCHDTTLRVRRWKAEQAGLLPAKATGPDLLDGTR